MELTTERLILRDAEYFKDRYWDTLMFGMLCEEWNGFVHQEQPRG